MEIVHIDDVEGERLGGLLHKILLTSGERMSCLYYKMEPGAESPPHAHQSEGILYCIDGELEVSVSGEKANVRKGTALVIPFNAEIGTKVLGSMPAEMLIVASPNNLGGDVM